jgi:hypothetical protein
VRSLRATALTAACTASVLAGAWHTVLITWRQWSVAPLPGVTLAAPLALLAAALVRPTPPVNVTDRETDFIISGVALVLGGWIVFWAPDRLGADFLFLRPDLIGVAFLTVALVAVVGGTRRALWLAPSVITVALVLIPAVQLGLVGFTPSALLAGTVAGLFGAAPLVVSRPFGHPGLGGRLALAVGGGAVGGLVVLMLHRSPADGSEAGAVLAVLALGGMAWFERRAALAARVRSGGPTLPALVAGLVAVALVGLLDVLVPTGAGALSVVHPPVLPASSSVAAYRTANGLTISSWSPAIRSGGNHAALVVTTIGVNATAVATYPLATVITWPEPACPNTATAMVDGTSVLDTAHLDSVNGYRWDTFEWSWSTATGFERIAVVVASAPTGQPAPLPATWPNARNNLIGTVGQLLANRHLRCAPVAPSAGSLGGDLVRQVMAQSAHGVRS